MSIKTMIGAPTVAVAALVGSLTGCSRPAPSAEEAIKAARITRTELSQLEPVTIVHREALATKEWKERVGTGSFTFGWYRVPAAALTLTTEEWADPSKVAKAFGKTWEQGDLTTLAPDTRLGSYQRNNGTFKDDYNDMVDITVGNLTEQAQKLRGVMQHGYRPRQGQAHEEILALSSAKGQGVGVD